MIAPVGARAPDTQILANFLSDSTADGNVLGETVV
jgi:hypothetical protein